MTTLDAALVALDDVAFEPVSLLVDHQPAHLSGVQTQGNTGAVMELTQLSDRELKDSYNERMAKLAQLRRNPVGRWKVQQELRGLTVERNRRYPPVR